MLGRVKLRKSDKGKRGFLLPLSFRARVFLALIAVSAIASLVIGLVVYYFAGNRLVEAESELLQQRSRDANANAVSFVEGLRSPEDESLPAPTSYAGELVSTVAEPTGLRVLYLGPGGEPLAATGSSGESINPQEVYRRLGLSEGIVERVSEAGQRDGLLIRTEGYPRYYAVWPLTGSGGSVRGVMVYYSPQNELNQTLIYLRYGIIGAIGTSVLLAGAASLLLTRQITRPLSETRDAAIRLASGDYSPVPVERGDELGEVNRAFNFMAEEIEHYIGELQEQKSRLETVLESSPEAVIATDPDQRVAMANPAAARMLGVRPTDLGRGLGEIGLPDEVLGCLEEAVSEGNAVREVESGGKTYWTYAARMQRESEGSAGFLLAVRDITEQRSVERAKTGFVSDVSHELRTPLTTIQSAVDLMERAKDRLDPMEHRALELAEGELARIRGMVEELLVLAQVDSWQYSLETGPADLTTVVQEAVDSVRAKAQRFGTEVHFEEEDEHRCACDSRKLYQVFLNLLDNAVKYSEPGSRVETTIEEDESFLAVKVKDSGYGIPEEDLDQLFERFYRVDKNRSRATGGSGLGLAIAKEIVELHGGEVSVESELGSGSTFEVRLPKTPVPVELAE